MPVTCRRVASVVFAVATLASSPILLADESGCEPPSKPILPADIASADRAAYLSQIVESALTDSSKYLACVQGTIDRGKDALSDDERKQLEQAYESEVARMRVLANEWNGLYASYAQRKTQR